MAEEDRRKAAEEDGKKAAEAALSLQHQQQQHLHLVTAHLVQYQNHNMALLGLLQQLQVRELMQRSTQNSAATSVPIAIVAPAVSALVPASIAPPAQLLYHSRASIFSDANTTIMAPVASSATASSAAGSAPAPVHVPVAIPPTPTRTLAPISAPVATAAPVGMAYSIPVASSTASMPLARVPAVNSSVTLSSGATHNSTPLQVADANRRKHLQELSALLRVTASGQQRVQVFQLALSPIPGTVLVPFPAATAPAAPSISTYQELKAKLDAPQSLNSINLPTLEETKMQFELSEQLSFETRRQEFSQSSLMAKAMYVIEGEARVILKNAQHEAFGAAKRMLDCLDAMGKLAGWQHVSWFVRNSDEYVAKTKAMQESAADSAVPHPFLTGAPAPGSLDAYQVSGQALIKRLAQRLEWVLMLLRRANQRFEAGFLFKVIAADRVWINAAKEVYWKK